MCRVRSWHAKYKDIKSPFYSSDPYYAGILVSFLYAHTNRFCVEQENIKPEVLRVPSLLGLCIKTEGFYIFLFSCTTQTG